MTAWLDLLPDTWEPEGLRDALIAQTQAQARHRAALAKLEGFEAHLADLAGDPDADLHAAALDVLAAERIVQVLPPVPVVSDHYADQIIANIATWFREHPAQLGAPPLVLAELRHHLEAHRQERPPRVTDREAELLPLFEATAQEVFKMRVAVPHHCRPLDSDPIGSRVTAWHSFRPLYDQHAELVAKMAAQVGDVDRERLASRELHHCPLWGSQHVGPLMSVDAFVAQIGEWTEKRAMFDGLPATAAPALVGA